MSGVVGLPDGPDALALVRRYEPVLHFTSGEMFFPMPVDDYLARAALWVSGTDGGPAGLLVDHGRLSPDALAAASTSRPSASLYLRYAPKELGRRQLRQWRRRKDRPVFVGVSRLAAVGLLGRLIDLGMRLSLTLRGRVPGGFTAASQQQYAASATPPRYAYHAHVSTDGGYVIIQYWFLYAMNDWRSSFGGVNDHEADWEQVTIYLVRSDGDADGHGDRDGDALTLAWVAFSSHDETGDDLRRRHDDPDIGWVDGTHPVVYAGAGSHSGAYLAGDYLVRVLPPPLARAFDVIARIRSRLFPWTRHDRHGGVGIPYVDYRRGDGVRVGPGTDRPWTPILVDATTPWVRDYRGLWGLDTDDPFGGERAPAGPRYERSGAIRASWGDPLGWAGLDKVPPTPTDRDRADADRLVELTDLVDDLDKAVATGQAELREAAAGLAVLPSTVTSARRGDGTAVRLVANERAIADLRSRRREAINERDQLRHVRRPLAPPPPHAHLRHRAVPDSTLEPTVGVLLRFWSGASLSILLILLGLALLRDWGPVLYVTIAAVLIVMAVEALLRRRLLLFLAGLAITSAIVIVIWLLATHPRTAFGVLALAAAAAIGVANLRTLLVRR
jgi:hypothetical protein